MSQSPSILLDVSVAMDTDVGRKRKQNQDAIGHMVPTDPNTLAKLGQIFVLADGVGGLSGGDLASQYAVSTIISSYYEQEEGDPPERLARAIAEANNIIFAEGQGQETPRIMATTVVAAVIRGRDLIIGSVGDSPAYLMRDANPRKLTLDHTVEELRREAGKPIDEGDPAGRKLVRALGTMPSVKVDIISGPVRDGDHVVLCSDGLTRYVSPQEIEETVATRPPKSAVKALIDMGNERGGADNISVIVLRLKDTDSTVELDPTVDLLEDWGQRTDDDQTQLHQPPVEADKRPRHRRAAPEPAENPLLDLWRFLRSNTVITGVGMGVLLIVFVIIMLVLSNAGGGDEPEQSKNSPTPKLAESAQTATAQVQAAATAQVIAIQTNDAIQAATAAQAAIMTLTPPTPIPTSGPQMPENVWFKVLDGDPIPAYVSPNTNSEEASALESGANYRITTIDREANNGPWYQVIDNTGLEARWVNGPSLHKRVSLVDDSGNPLPDDQQPPDVPPPGQAPPSPRTSTPSPPPTTPADAGPEATAEPLDTPEAPGITDTPAPTATIPYGVELWDVGTNVAIKENLILRQTQKPNGLAAGEALQGETGTVIAGPVAAEGHWWWQIQFEDGRTGWIAQVLLGAP